MLVRTVDSKSERRVVEHLLEAVKKQNLKGFLWKLGSQYMVSTFIWSDLFRGSKIVTVYYLCFCESGWFRM
jgi:c-di-GMP-related signal transduction protein